MKKQFRIFLKPQHSNLKIPLNLSDIESRIQQDYYKVPQDLFKDIDIINDSILENSYATDELIDKVLKYLTAGSKFSQGNPRTYSISKLRFCMAMLVLLLVPKV